MAEDTAVLERLDTAPPAEATSEEAESAELVDAETGDVEEQTETEEGPDLRNDPQVLEILAEERKSLEARLNESFRQREENARKAEREAASKAAYDALRTAVDPANAVDSYRAIRSAMQKVYDDGTEPKEVEAAIWQVIQNTYAAGVSRVPDVIVDATNGYLDSEFKGFTVPDDVNDQFRAAQAKLDYPGMLKAALKAATVAADAAGYERGKKEAEAALSTGQKLKATDDARKAIPRPTTTTGAPTSRQTADAVLASAHPLSPEYGKAYREKYGFDPPSPY